MKAVFLDKDGTLIKDVPYNVNPSLIQPLPGVIQGLQTLHRAGYKLIIVSNQSGVARGYFEEADLLAVEERLRELLDCAGVPLAGFYYCPHHPDGVVLPYAQNCSCRKPGPGLLLRAAQEHGLNLHQSWMVGDILDDIEAGRRAGCKTVLLNNGHETEWRLSEHRRPHYTASSFFEISFTIRLMDGLIRPKAVRAAYPPLGEHTYELNFTPVG